MNAVFSVSSSSWFGVGILLIFACVVDPLSATDREEIREASGRYRGGISGSVLLGDTANAITDGVTISTRLPRKKGRFTNRLIVEEFEGYEGELGTLLELNGRINRIKVRGKKVRYRGVIKIDNPFGLDSAPMVGLLNALSKRTRSGHTLNYPITLSRVLEADNYDFLDDDLQLAIFLNFKGEK